MADAPQVTIGSQKLFSSALASEYDALTMAEMDPMTIAELIGDITTLIFMGSPMTIDHNIDGRSTATFVVEDETGIMSFRRGQPILIDDGNGAKEFAGFVSNAETTKLPGASIYQMHTIDAGDYWYILERRIAVYTAANILAGSAVWAIWKEYLEAEGITIGLIEDGELLTEVSVNYKTIAEVFNKIASGCDSFICYVDYEKKLYFHRRSLYAAAWNISDGTDFLKDSMVITRSNENYRNTEIIIGGTEETDLQTEQFIADGTAKSWALGYKVSRISLITVTPPGGGDPDAQTVGTKGSDTGSFEFYYAVESETLTAETAPAAGSLIEVRYYGLFSIITKAEDASAIASNALLEGGGTGIVEHITSDESLKSLDAATEYANAKLNEYAREGISITYDTMRGEGEELAAGTVQDIAVMGVDDDFLITTASKIFLAGGLRKWSIEAVNGAMHEAWDAFFGKGLGASGTVREGVDDQGTVTKVQNFAHTFYDVDRPTPYVLAFPGAGVLPGTDTWPCFEPLERFEYIVLYRGGVEFFRKQHAQVLTEQADEATSISFIAPSEGNEYISHVGFWGGNSCSSTPGSGVELFKTAWSHLKTIFESLQINCVYTNGDA